MLWGWMKRERSFFMVVDYPFFGSFRVSQEENLLPSSWLIIRFWIIWVSQEENVVLPSSYYWFLDHLGFTRRERCSSFIVVDYLFLDHLGFTRRERCSSFIVVDYPFLDHLGFTRRRERSSFIMVNYWFLDHLGFTNLRDIECIILAPWRKTHHQSKRRVTKLILLGHEEFWSDFLILKRNPQRMCA